MTGGATGESDRSHATMKRKATYRSGSRGAVVGRPTQRLSVKSTMQEAGRWDDVGVDERCDRRVVVEGEAEEGEGTARAEAARAQGPADSRMGPVRGATTYTGACRNFADERIGQINRARKTAN